MPAAGEVEIVQPVAFAGEAGQLDIRVVTSRADIGRDVLHGGTMLASPGAGRQHRYGQPRHRLAPGAKVATRAEAVVERVRMTLRTATAEVRDDRRSTWHERV